MNQKLWSSLTTAALMITTLGNAASSYASQPTVNDEISETNVPQESSNSQQGVSTSSSTELISETAVSQDNPGSNQVASTLPSTTSATAPADEVAKVGEYQSQEEVEEEEEAIAIIQPHSMGERQAATLYVRSIPVLTFISATAASTTTETDETANSTSTSAGVKVGSTQDSETTATEQSDVTLDVANQDSSSDPVQRATAIAAQINQMHLNSINADTINVRWDATRERYVIVVNGEELVEMNSATILPDSTRDPAQDALQATNRLRRLVGDAPPLRDIEGRPQPAAPQISLGPVQLQLRGMASWYGPGFHGNRSASGEVFNQNALTAAHRNLPFGTQVRVTNLNTGLSVVVRITDRGPFARGRVIDLSAGAARVIGLISSGVAPVRLDVMEPTRTASSAN